MWQVCEALLNLAISDNSFELFITDDEKVIDQVECLIDAFSILFKVYSSARGTLLDQRRLEMLIEHFQRLLRLLQVSVRTRRVLENYILPEVDFQLLFLISRTVYVLDTNLQRRHWTLLDLLISIDR